MSQITENASRFLIGVPEGIPEGANPWQREGGSTYLRFDGISVTNGPDDGEGVRVSFGWRGREMCVIRVRGVQLGQGQTLELRGIEGRQGVRLDE